MRLTVRGQGLVDLGPREFLASGGEGDVYVVGSTAYKVYQNPARAISEGKISELAGIADPDVIRPAAPLLDASGSVVGYTMRFVSGGIPLCQTFTRAFREREGVDHAKALAVVERMKRMVAGIHTAGVLVVDLNEMNFLVDLASTSVYAIDVDSYQTRSFPATALMPSVRDHQVAGSDWTENSDWFSFAVIACQMFLGIHPYRGRHPSIKSMEDRMRAGASIFDPAVSVPRGTYDPSIIPQGYRLWLRLVLQDGKRLAPPTDPGAFAQVVVRAATLQAVALVIEEVASYRAVVRWFATVGGVSVAALADGSTCVDGRYSAVESGGAFESTGSVTLLTSRDDRVFLVDPTTCEETPVLGSSTVVVSGVEFPLLRNADFVFGLDARPAGRKTLAITRVVANIHPRATRAYAGVLIQDLLGSMFASVFPRKGAHVQVRVPELDDYKVVDARFDRRVLVVVGSPKRGHAGLQRLTLLFDAQYQRYSFSAEPTGGDALNFVVLDSGVVVHLGEDDKLDLWHVDRPKEHRVVEDPALSGDMRLVRVRGRAGFIRGDKVYTLTLK